MRHSHSHLAAFIIFAGCLQLTVSMRVTGTWSTSKGRLKVVAKFGFQQIDILDKDKEHSRGFIYGNITSQHDTKDRAVFFIVPQKLISTLFSDSMYGQSCDSMLQNISSLAFETRCLPKGKGDIMRWIPCSAGKLCDDEDVPTKVINGYQMTLRIDEPYTPEYWYVVFVACVFDGNCNWTTSKEGISINYDIWLTNGSPLTKHINPFSHQFSFDEQDTAEMYMLFLILYIVLSLCQWRAAKLSKQQQLPPRQKLLCCIIAIKTVGLMFQTFDVVMFAYDGEGVVIVRFLGEIARLMSICLLCLLLILLSRGWSLSETSSVTFSRLTLVAWSAFTLTHLVLFLINFFFVDDIFHDIDVFKSWPGYGMLLVRMGQALWFLAEIRSSIQRETIEEKAVFLAHFGAGFLVWFVYLSGLGVISSFISLLWRFKIILAITTLANFLAISCLVHLFWPTSENRRYFSADTSLHRRMGRTDSHEMDDFERLLLADKTNSDTDFPSDDDSHDI